MHKIANGGLRFVLEKFDKLVIGKKLKGFYEQILTSSITIDA